MVVAVIDYMRLAVDCRLWILDVVETGRPFLLNAIAGAIALEDARLANLEQFR